MKKAIKKLIKGLRIWIFSSMFIFLLCFLIALGDKEAKNPYQFMEKINYDITLTENGDAKIIETWDINVSRTNTLYKNFNRDNNYTKISDVNVMDLDTGKYLNRIKEEKYPVDLDCFYALQINYNKFEIAFGVGMEKEYGRRKFQISYTVEDVVKEYKDCEEFYWKFLDEANGIPINKVTGQIHLPNKIENIENLKVWGHESLNGEIDKLSNDTIRFEIDNLSKNKSLEVRVISEEDLFNVVNYTNKINTEKLNEILKEEADWKESSNKTIISDKMIRNIVLVIIYSSIFIYFALKIKKYYKIYKTKNEKTKKIELEYFKDIPREDATPIEAIYLKYFNPYDKKISEYQAEMLAATILNLCLKKYIKIDIENNNKGKEKVYICIKKDEHITELLEDEIQIYNLLEKIQGKKEKFEMNDLKKYAEDNHSHFNKVIHTAWKKAKKRLYDLNLINREYKKEYESKSIRDAIILGFALVTTLVIPYTLIGYIPMHRAYIANILGPSFIEVIFGLFLGALPIIIEIYILSAILEMISKKIEILTKLGKEEKEKWDALERYMKDYSLLKEKEIPDLLLWEKYLVYATAFGISDDIIEQMDANYHQVLDNNKKVTKKAKGDLQNSGIIHRNIVSNVFICSKSACTSAIKSRQVRKPSGGR